MCHPYARPLFVACGQGVGQLASETSNIFSKSCMNPKSCLQNVMGLVRGPLQPSSIRPVYVAEELDPHILTSQRSTGNWEFPFLSAAALAIACIHTYLLAADIISGTVITVLTIPPWHGV